MNSLPDPLPIEQGIFCTRQSSPATYLYVSWPNGQPRSVAGSRGKPWNGPTLLQYKWFEPDAELLEFCRKLRYLRMKSIQLKLVTSSWNIIMYLLTCWPGCLHRPARHNWCRWHARGTWHHGRHVVWPGALPVASNPPVCRHRPGALADWAARSVHDIWQNAEHCLRRPYHQLLEQVPSWQCPCHSHRPDCQDVPRCPYSDTCLEKEIGIELFKLNAEEEEAHSCSKWNLIEG